LLEQAGIKGARAMLGGYNAWLGAGYPVVKGDQPR
jgi:rhodanese-related sulfurtransferase